MNDALRVLCDSVFPWGGCVTTRATKMLLQCISPSLIHVKLLKVMGDSQLTTILPISLRRICCRSLLFYLSCRSKSLICIFLQAMDSITRRALIIMLALVESCGLYHAVAVIKGTRVFCGHAWEHQLAWIFKRLSTNHKNPWRALWRWNSFFLFLTDRLPLWTQVGLLYWHYSATYNKKVTSLIYLCIKSPTSISVCCMLTLTIILPLILRHLRLLCACK